MINNRRKLLKYLKGKNEEGYQELIKKLGLRKSLQDKSFNGYLKSIRDTSYSILQKEK